MRGGDDYKGDRKSVIWEQQDLDKIPLKFSYRNQIKTFHGRIFSPQYTNIGVLSRGRTSSAPVSWHSG